MSAFASVEDWLAAFRAAPDLCLDRLLCHADSIDPMQRGFAADMAATALRAGGEDDRALADAALARWLGDRLDEDEAAVRAVGRDAYATYAREGLFLAAWLPLPVTGALVRDRYQDFIDWTRGLSDQGESADLCLVYLSALAANQTGPLFRQEWLGYCDRAGAGSLSPAYFDAGLQGLRKMRPDQAPKASDLAEALARWASHLRDTPEDKAQFLELWQVLQQGHPRQHESWANPVAQVLGRFGLRPFARWWRGRLDLAAGSVPVHLHAGKTEEMLTELGKAKTEAEAEAKVATFFSGHLAYATASGDWGDFPRALNRVGHRVLARGWPALAARIARLIVDYVPSNGPSWVLLSEALAGQGLAEVAESVLWDSGRFLPDNAHVQVSLAKLMERQGRLGEAEALYRQALAAFPDNVACHTGLAHLVVEAGPEGLAEAEALYRRALRLEPDHGHSLLGLGLALIRRDKFAEIPGLIQVLDKLGDSGATTLRYRYRVSLGEIPPKADAVESAPPPAVAAGAEWQTELAVGKALRARFLLSDALDQPGLRFIDDGARTDLRAKAEALLAEAVARAPHHPVVAMIARRRAGHSPEPVDESLLTAGRDFGRRLELIRVAQRSDALDWLAEDFTDAPAQVMIALARMELDCSDDQTLGQLRRWLAQPAEDLPVLPFAHGELRRRLPDWALRGADEFVEAWETHLPAASLSDLLDILQLAYALPSLPLLADEAMLALEPA